MVSPTLSFFLSLPVLASCRATAADYYVSFGTPYSRNSMFVPLSAPYFLLIVRTLARLNHHSFDVLDPFRWLRLFRFREFYKERVPFDLSRRREIRRFEPKVSFSHLLSFSLPFSSQ